MKKRNLFLVSHFWRSLVLHFGTAALVSVPAIRPLPAQFMVQPVNLTYLCQRADIIVQGQVIDVRQERLPGYANIPTVKITLGVERMLRGAATRTYTFREVFVGLRPKQAKQDYRIGQRLILFLTAPSQYGLSSPVGIGQGRFHIAGDKRGVVTVANERGNAELFREVERSANKAGMRLTTNQLRILSTERGPVALVPFVSLIKSLTSLPRIR